MRKEYQEFCEKNSTGYLDINVDGDQNTTIFFSQTFDFSIDEKDQAIGLSHSFILPSDPKDYTEVVRLVRHANIS